MNCKKCGKDIDGSFGSGIFCSRKCANSRLFTEESNRKKSESNKKRYIENGSWGGMLTMLDENERKKIVEKRKIFYRKSLLAADFETLSFDRKRKRVKIEQDGKCFECGLKEWRNKKIVLEIEHKDGNPNNNKRDNLIALCPNCHSITLTWRGRNKPRDKKWLSGPEIYNLYKSGKNIRQILLSMNFAAKGDNYTRVKRIIENFES